MKNKMLTRATFSILTNKWRSSYGIQNSNGCSAACRDASCHARCDGKCSVCGSDPGNGADSGVQPPCVAQRRHGNKAEIARQDHLENRGGGRSGEFESRAGRESREHHGCKGWVCRGCDRLSRREGRNAGQTRRSWPEIGVPEG